MTKFRILAVDDKKATLDGTRYCLEPMGVNVDIAQTPEDAISKFKTNQDSYALVILDYDIEHPTINGADLIQLIKRINPKTTVFIYSGVKDRETLKKCWEAGASEFIDKGAETVTEELRSKVLAQCKKFRETLEPFQYQIEKTENFNLINSVKMIGVSDAMADVARKIIRFKDRTETVIIYGNTGTGKELVSRALHNMSTKPFLVVNCAAFRDTQLLESELFGYDKGAFTGADRTKIGMLEEAKGGTIFFDEIHLLSLEGQAKLLRAFQDKKIRRLGSSHEFSVTCRFIVAAKPDLEDRVSGGEFLADFFYRINKLSIHIPDLRERPEDIEPLVNHFVDVYNKRESVQKSLRMSVLKQMKSYPWPGNVRELENAITQLLTNCSENFVELTNLAPKYFNADETKMTLKALEARHKDEIRQLIIQTIAKHQYKMSAAKELGIAPSSLATLEKQLNINQPQPKVEYEHST